MRFGRLTIQIGSADTNQSCGQAYRSAKLTVMVVAGDVDSNQRFRDGLPPEAALDDKMTSTTHSLQIYRTQEWSGDSPSDCLADDAQKFTLDDLKSMNSNTSQNLQNLFRIQGLFLPKG